VMKKNAARSCDVVMGYEVEFGAPGLTLASITSFRRLVDWSVKNRGDPPFGSIIIRDNLHDFQTSMASSSAKYNFKLCNFANIELDVSIQ